LSLYNRPGGLVSSYLNLSLLFTFRVLTIFTRKLLAVPDISRSVSGFWDDPAIH
jgi:hypothetical protein